jgi:hypothetical protein
VTNDIEGPLDKYFINGVDTGVSICIRFDKHTFPKDLNWVGDGLIENIETGIKNSKNINLVVVWETGEEWKKNYRITTTLHEDYLEHRSYHGVTHIMRNINTNEEAMELIVLKELIEYLNNPTEAQKKQFKKYEEDED